VLLLRTAVAALRASGHAVSLLAPSTAGGALRGHGPAEVDSVLPWEAAGMATLLAGEGPLADDVTRALAPFEAVVAYTHSPALLHALSLSGARVIARPPLPPKEGPHAARWYADAVLALGTAPAPVPPLLVPTAAEEAAAREWTSRLGPGFLAVHPGSGSPRKNWPAERFEALVSALSPDRRWLLVEGPAESEAFGPLRALPHAVLARELPVRVLGAVLARAGLYVGNDSGVSHLAGAYGAPTIALFGPTDPALWSPVGPRVSVLRSPTETMAALVLEDVIAAGVS
jgi:heptosyltransferase-3